MQEVEVDLPRLNDQDACDNNRSQIDEAEAEREAESSIPSEMSQETETVSLNNIADLRGAHLEKAGKRK